MTPSIAISDYIISREEAQEMHESFYDLFQNRRNTKHIDFRVQELRAIIDGLKDEDKISFYLAAYLNDDGRSFRRYQKKDWADEPIPRKEDLDYRVTLVIRAEAQNSMGAASIAYYDAGTVCPPPPACRL